MKRKSIAMKITTTPNRKRLPRITKGLAAILVAVTVTLVGTMTALAESATLAVTAGTLSVTAANVTMGGITLDGTDQQSTSAAAGNSWSAVDGRGSGLGWNVTITATNFIDGIETIAVTGFRIQLLDANITLVGGNAKPTSSVTTATTMSGVALKIASAAIDAGMGSYTLKPNFELDVPAETVAAASYTSTIVIAANSAP